MQEGPAAGCAGAGEAPAVVVATSPTLSQAPQPLWQLDGVQWFVVLPQKPAELQTDKGRRGGSMQPIGNLPPKKNACSSCTRRQLRPRANILGAAHIRNDTNANQHKEPMLGDMPPRRAWMRSGGGGCMGVRACSTAHPCRGPQREGHTCPGPSPPPPTCRQPGPLPGPLLTPCV